MSKLYTTQERVNKMRRKERILFFKAVVAGLAMMGVIFWSLWMIVG